jgi:S1-C subfamily serine protease
MSVLPNAHRFLTVALLMFNIGAAATMAQAQQVEEFRRPVSQQLPKLGFYGHIVYGQGLVIENVSWGTEAAHIGLERGDMIVSVNGQPIRNWNDYNLAMYYSGGSGRLVVRDWRSGALLPVAFVLDNGRGPSGHAFEHP